MDLRAGQRPPRHRERSGLTFLVLQVGFQERGPAAGERTALGASHVPGLPGRRAAGDWLVPRALTPEGGRRRSMLWTADRITQEDGGLRQSSCSSRSPLPITWSLRIRK